MGDRRKMREYAIQFMFQCDLNNQFSTNDDELLIFYESFDIEPLYRFDLSALLKHILSKLSQIDKTIEEQSTNWKLFRMAKVDKAVLRLAVFELLFKPDVPSVVIINEAVEIGKKFGSENSNSFINGLLDKAAKRLREETKGLINDTEKEK